PPSGRDDRTHLQSLRTPPLIQPGTYKSKLRKYRRYPRLAEVARIGDFQFLTHTAKLSSDPLSTHTALAAYKQSPRPESVITSPPQESTDPVHFPAPTFPRPYSKPLPARALPQTRLLHQKQSMQTRSSTRFPASRPMQSGFRTHLSFARRYTTPRCKAPQPPTPAPSLQTRRRSMPLDVPAANPADPKSKSPDLLP